MTDNYSCSFFSRIISIKPVSYTHLDVYKRQISYLFVRLEEVTPLMLQKMLYFVQGVSYAVIERPMFYENCQAWIHGPVYPEVYEMFRDFKYNPIEDARFAILNGAEDVYKRQLVRNILKD